MRGGALCGRAAAANLGWFRNYFGGKRARLASLFIILAGFLCLFVVLRIFNLEKAEREFGVTLFYSE